jgi:hypothetical protein
MLPDAIARPCRPVDGRVGSQDEARLAESVVYSLAQGLDQFDYRFATDHRWSRS